MKDMVDQVESRGRERESKGTWGGFVKDQVKDQVQGQVKAK